MSGKFIILIADDEKESSTPEGQKGWREEVIKRVSGLKEIKLEPAELESKMTDFLSIVERLFQRSEKESSQQSGMQLVSRIIRH